MGEICQPCTGGTVCQPSGMGGGSCQTPQAAGTPCGDSSECVSLGANALCRTSTATGVVYPAGFCTLDCSQGSSICPPGNTCVSTGGLFGESTALCWPNCTPGLAGNCREPGYLCYPLGGGAGGCWLDPAAPAGLEGSPCDGGAACVTPTGPGQGFCNPATLPDGGTNFPGGSCSANCAGWSMANSAEGDLYCGGGASGGGAICAWTASQQTCAQACSNPFAGQDTCRTGYVCTNDIKPSPEAYCEPSCANPGASCQTGYLCDAGYCCPNGGGACL
jgi:hypothetical protein